MKNLSDKQVFWLVLTAASVAAAALSLYIGLKQSVWFDEAYSVALAQHSWGEIVSLTAKDVHPPLYYWFLKVWVMLFGSGELALRSMSALLLGLSVGVAGLLLRRLFDTKAALVSLPFIVFAPFLLRYGFEIRMYALASLIGIVATYTLVAAVEAAAGRRRWLLFAAYALLVAAGVYTLYFTALLWMAHVAWVAWLAYQERRQDIALFALAAYAAAFAVFVPWLPVFLSKAGGGTLSPVTHSLDLENLFGVVTYLFLYQPPWNIKGLGFVVIALIVFVVAYLAVRGYKSATHKERRYLGFVAAYFFIPVLILVVVTQVKPIYIERYVAHIAIGAYMGVGVMVALALRRANWWVRLASGGLLAVLAFGCVSAVQYGNYNFQRVHHPSVEQAAALLSDCKNGAVIFADGPQVAVELDYYIQDCPVYFFNETLSMGGGFAMISNSPLRVANASELPQTSEVLHVYYDKPKNTMPPSFYRDRTEKAGPITVAVYQTK